MTVEEWLEDRLAADGPAAQAAVRRVLDEARALEAEAYVTEADSQVSLRFPAATLTGSVVALEIKPDPASFTLPLGWLRHAEPYDDRVERRSLLEALTGIVGEVSSENLRGFATFPAERLASGDAADRFGALLEEVAQRLSGEAEGLGARAAVLARRAARPAPLLQAGALLAFGAVVAAHVRRKR